jgi:hypothetical protein
MAEKLKTVCVGRYLIDVPAVAEVSLSGSMIAGFELETVEESEATFRDRINAREIEVSVLGREADGRTKGDMVSARDLRVPGMLGRLLVFGRSRGYLMEGERRVDMESVSVEAHGHMGGLSFSLSATSTVEASATEAEALLARLHLRNEDEIPTGPGFCTWRAVFSEPLETHTNEHMVMHLGLPGHPDVAVALISVAGGNPGPGLLARIAHMDANASPNELLRVTKLRMGKRSINGLAGEEGLERLREINFATTYSFNWEAPGEKDDLLRPYLALELQAGISDRPGGKPVDASLHEDALLAFWDTIASSIRLRPNSPPRLSKMPPEPTVPKLGAVAN